MHQGYTALTPSPFKASKIAPSATFSGSVAVMEGASLSLLPSFFRARIFPSRISRTRIRSERKTIATPKTDAKMKPGLKRGDSRVRQTASVNQMDWILRGGQCRVETKDAGTYKLNIFEAAITNPRIS
jgi:hypothetical protein